MSECRRSMPSSRRWRRVRRSSASCKRRCETWTRSWPIRPASRRCASWRRVSWPSSNASKPELEHNLQLLLLPKDAADEKSAMLEIRAGTGGDEAALFAGNLLRMYQRYAELRGWKFEVMDLHETDLSGVKEAVASISGKGVFARLQIRVRRPSRTAGAGNRVVRTHTHQRRHGCGLARARGDRHRDR